MTQRESFEKIANIINDHTYMEAMNIVYNIVLNFWRHDIPEDEQQDRLDHLYNAIGCKLGLDNFISEDDDE